MKKTDLTNILKASIDSLSKPGGQKHTLPKYNGDLPTLYVFRHGETKDNKRRIFSGRRNTDLTEEGVLQSLKLAGKLRKENIDIAYCPPLIRCRKTLKLAIKSKPKVKINYSDLLLERDYGDLTGRSKTKLNKKDPELTAKYRRGWDFPPPNGESLKMVWQNRIEPFCKEIEKFALEKRLNLAVCCTNNTMRLIRMHFEQLTIEQMQQLENPLATDYCSYSFLSK